MDVTRRTLARMLAATAAVPIAATAQAPAGSQESDDVKAARERQRNTAQQLDKVALPMSTEPAFRFKA